MRRPALTIIKLFSCSTQLSMNFQLRVLIKSKMLTKTFLGLKLSDVVIILLISGI